MEQKGKSTLIGKTATLVGFGFAPHPLQLNCYIESVVYQLANDEFVLCLAQGEGEGNPVEQRKGLGQKVPGVLFAPFAERHINGIDFLKLQEIMAQGMPEMKFEWIKNELVTGNPMGPS
jgi:hypothetical protein